ncbi:hypothetical protein [Aquamicrobium soli]|uniref:Uncharacterized protein n=1 Tax=Aquamicrobium soli TaxID=1811518 RepID=A0ABV7KER2_9HYPH
MPTTITIAGYKHAVLTADEFIAQGTAPGAIMSIGEHLSTVGQPLLAAEVRSVAREVAHITGQRLAVPGAVNDARLAARKPRMGAPKHANDNSRGSNNRRDSNRQHGKLHAGRKQERRAA